MISLWLVTAGLMCCGAGTVGAQVRLDVSYEVTLAGLPIGAIAGGMELAQNRFRVTAAGRTSGVLQILTNGHGEILSNGVRFRGEALPSTYASAISIRDREEKVRVTFTNRNATEVLIDPEPTTAKNILPLTDANRKRVVDPLSAVIISMSGAEIEIERFVCERSASVFDGQLRYDLKLTFKRFVDIDPTIGFRNRAVVCSISFVPIAGHDPNRFLFKYLADQRDMEIWFAPIVGAEIAIPYRISIRTPLGLGVMEAKQSVIKQAPASDSAR